MRYAAGRRAVAVPEKSCTSVDAKTVGGRFSSAGPVCGADLLDDHAAVDHQQLSGHVVRFRAGQESGRSDKGCQVISLFPAEDLPIANRY